MNKEEIITVLSDWNFWKEEIETGIKREYLDYCLDVISSRVNKILTIIGVRRCGKSFLTKQMVKKLGKLMGNRNTLIVNFEEVAFDEELTEKFLLKIFEAYDEIIKPSKKPLIVLDEVQKVKNWEKFVRTFQEKNKGKIIVTGSSAKLMSEELATLLTGRTIEIRLLPLSFKEFLKFNKIEIREKLEILLRRGKLIKMLREYLEIGGFPEVVLEEKINLKKEILRKIYEDIILKDVVIRFRIKNAMKLGTLARFYIFNFSSSITFNRIAKFLKLPVKTVEIYSKNLETSNLLFFVKRFSFSIKEQENSPRKIYVVDNGLFTSTGLRISENYGKLMENLVAVEMKRRGKEFYYWKGREQKEVDFVIKEGSKVKQLIQVCYNIEDFNTKEREIKALIKASEELKCKNLLVITWDHEGEEKIKRKKIKFKPLWKWLLSKIL